MKYQVLFSLKNNEKVFMNVVYCSRDWRFKVNIIELTQFPYFFGHKVEFFSFQNSPKNLDL